MEELISKQQAIDAYGDWYVEEGTEEGFIGTVKQLLEGLPSAQPEQCEDAVSRQTLKDGFTEMCNLICPYTKKEQHVMCGSCLMGTAFDVLEVTPSVTPKQRKGKWIHISEEMWKCDQCGEISCCSPNFCPDCGAKMEVTE